MKARHMVMGLVLALGPAWSLTAVETVVMAGDLYPPYITDGGQGGPGFVVEILQAILVKAGYRVSFRLTPWTRAVHDVKEGRADLLLLSTKDKAEAAGLAVNEEPLGVAVLGWYTGKASRWTFTGVDSLAGQLWAIIDGYPYPFPDYIRAHRADPSRITVVMGDRAMELNLRKLANGHGSVLLDDQTVVGSMVRKLGLEKDIREAGTYGEPLPMYPLFSPKGSRSAVLSRLITDGVRTLRKSGELQRILARYQVKDWGPAFGK